MADDNETERGTGRSVLDELPLDQLKDAGKEYLDALMSRAVSSVSGKVEGLTNRLTGVSENGGSGLMAAITGAKDAVESGSPTKGALKAGVVGAKEKTKEAVGAGGGGGSSGGGGGGGGSSAKVVNILEEFDVGLPLRVAYDQWTQFQDYPGFTRKVEKVDQESDETVSWTAQIFLSHRTWESTIIEQVPDERIVWRSKGSKGHVDGAVTFHELAPRMTRVLLVLEYHPQGFFEKTANLWRAQGRRARSDFRHIKRHMMTSTIFEQEESEGWRGEIRDGEVVKSHEDAVQEEQDASRSDDDSQEDEEADYEDDYDDEDDDEDDDEGN